MKNRSVEDLSFCSRKNVCPCPHKTKKLRKLPATSDDNNRSGDFFSSSGASLKKYQRGHSVMVRSGMGNFWGEDSCDPVKHESNESPLISLGGGLMQRESNNGRLGDSLKNPIFHPLFDQKKSSSAFKFI